MHKETQTKIDDAVRRVGTFPPVARQNEWGRRMAQLTTRPPAKRGELWHEGRWRTVKGVLLGT